MQNGATSRPSWADWQDLPAWAGGPGGPGFERQLREVYVLCADEAARQMGRALEGRDPRVARASLEMLAQSASALGAAVLKDLCVRLLAAGDAELLALGADCGVLIDDLVAELGREIAAPATH